MYNWSVLLGQRSLLYAAYADFDSGRLGVVEGDSLRDVTPALDVLPAYRYPLPTFDLLITNLPAVIEHDPRACFRRRPPFPSPA